MKSITIGDKAPAFSVSLHDQSVKKLSDYKGQTLILYFYPKDDTPGCTVQATDFTSLQQEFTKIGVSILGISKDSVAKHEKFRTKHSLTIDLGADEDTKMIEAYGCWVEKNMYGKKYMGIERSSFVIDKNSKIQQIWRKVKAKGHAARLLEQLQEAQT